MEIKVVKSNLLFIKKRKLDMTWRNNMSTHTAANITSYSGKTFTSISFSPDLKRFGMKNLDNDIVCLMKKRVYDLAGIFAGKLKVTFNFINTDFFKR